jgi:hypothetical protein
MLLFILAITAMLPCIAQSTTVDPIPESAAKDTVLFWSSVGANGLSTFLKWNSSWKQVALDPIHAEPNGPYQGRYYTRATVYDWGVFSIMTTGQYFLVRKFPQLKKTFSIVNFSSSGLNMAQFGYNTTGH